MYSILKPLLFSLDAEAAHNVSLKSLQLAHKLKLTSLFYPNNSRPSPTTVMGLEFPSRVGLAAGLDKNGDYIDALAALGFGFIEIGTITPVAQPGNPKPRLFRLTAENAIINRMGFNNKGVSYLVDQVKARNSSGLIGINIGKNKATPDEAALLDYESCLDSVYAYADYITVNVSSPNTPGLRALQFGEVFRDLLTGIKNKQLALQAEHKKYVPVAVKIAPDMSDEELCSVADTIADVGLDAIIATNTTVARDQVANSKYKDEVGGLSGLPVRDKSTHAIKVLSQHLDGRLPIIGVGGILSGDDAREKLEAGAALVQLYSGLIYRGPGLVKEASKAAAALFK